MKCLVTAGPAYETLDAVRRLTNFSTGRLGSELAGYLASLGHDVILLKAACALHQGGLQPDRIVPFTTAADLHSRLRALASDSVQAVFHAAAVSDFAFGKVWQRLPSGELREVHAEKLSSRQGKLLVELEPVPKVIAHLRAWFPPARIVGWKYEVDGDRAQALSRAQQQLLEYQTDACVLNGRAYGVGYGLVTPGGLCQHLPDSAALFAAAHELTVAPCVSTPSRPGETH